MFRGPVSVLPCIATTPATGELGLTKSAFYSHLKHPAHRLPLWWVAMSPESSPAFNLENHVREPSPEHAELHEKSLSHLAAWPSRSLETGLETLATERLAPASVSSVPSKWLLLGLHGQRPHEVKRQLTWTCRGWSSWRRHPTSCHIRWLKRLLKTRLLCQVDIREEVLQDKQGPGQLCWRW